MFVIDKSLLLFSKTWKGEMIKNRLKRREECDTYLTQSVDICVVSKSWWKDKGAFSLDLWLSSVVAVELMKATALAKSSSVFSQLFIHYADVYRCESGRC